MTNFDRWVKPAACIVTLVIAGSASAGTGSVKNLEMPPPERSLETVHRTVTAVGTSELKDGVQRVVVMPDKQNFLIETSYKPKGTTRAESFGTLLDSRRQSVPAGNLPPDWRAVVFAGARIHLFDGAWLTFVEVDGASFKELTRRTLAWDLIRPPRDRGGEATPGETGELRASFKRRYLSTLGLKITGLARIPAAWEGGKGVRYLAATRIKGFPLLLLECQADELAQCMVARQCYLEGAKDLEPGAVSGIAVSAERKLVLIGDAKQRRLVAFRYQSCYHVPATGAVWELPAKLKGLTNLHVDAQDGLWVTTDGPDDYTAASLYNWPAAAW